MGTGQGWGALELLVGAVGTSSSPCWDVARDSSGLPGEACLFWPGKGTHKTRHLGCSGQQFPNQRLLVLLVVVKASYLML